MRQGQVRVRVRVRLRDEVSLCKESLQLRMVTMHRRTSLHRTRTNQSNARFVCPV